MARSESEITATETTGQAAEDMRLGIDDFARLLGTSVDTFDPECRRLIAESDFRFRRLARRERDDVILRVLKQAASSDLTVAGKEAKPRWERGWSENLDGFVKTGFDVTQLVPKYIHASQPLRLEQDFVMPINPAFELQWYFVFRRWLFSNYLREASSIYEVGCGSGYNLVTMAEMFPDKKIYGLDWAEPSCEIANKLADAYGWSVEGHVFDVFAPDPRLKLDHNAAVITIGCLEQTGTDYRKFIDYLLGQRPALVIHSEPIFEWYDEENVVDYSAMLIHKRRRFMEGLPGLLKQLEAEGAIEVLKTKRSYFGSLFMEGYSQIVWRPRGAGEGARRDE